MSTMNESFLFESLRKPEQIIFGMRVCCIHPHKSTHNQNPHRSFRRCGDRGLASHCWVIIAAAPVLLFLLVSDTLRQPSFAAASKSFLFPRFENVSLTGSSVSTAMHHMKGAWPLPLSAPPTPTPLPRHPTQPPLPPKQQLSPCAQHWKDQAKIEFTSRQPWPKVAHCSTKGEYYFKAIETKKKENNLKIYWAHLGIQAKKKKKRKKKRILKLFFPLRNQLDPYKDFSVTTTNNKDFSKIIRCHKQSCRCQTNVLVNLQGFFCLQTVKNFCCHDMRHKTPFTPLLISQLVSFQCLLNQV